MTYPNPADVATDDAVSGIATAPVFMLRAGWIQVSVSGVTGTGTVTLTAQPFGSDAYEAITDGTIDLTAQTTVTIFGLIKNLKATSSVSGDAFTLVVTKL